MYTDALEFLEEDRDGWEPFEALLDQPDEALERPTPEDGPAHGWRGRDLIAHLVGWQEVALAAAKELAVNEEAPVIARFRSIMDGGVDVHNETIADEWRSLPLDEVRRRARSVAGELRGHLTVVPETRWLKHPTNMRFFAENTVDHYAEHGAELEAILAEPSS
ncbi:MAG: maleylpyruvate isomerase N-terminal domain-containing protein [Chloroflexi bacterium]|nr:maleylpyruvate isomerase N-terminal domain-containing protein [Chloroflexota bacterium]